MVNKNKMHITSEEVVKATVQDIMNNFSNQLHVNGLVKNIPQYNQPYPTRIVNTALMSSQLPYPPLNRPFHPTNLKQDYSPPCIPLDQFATNLIKSLDHKNDLNIYKVPQESAQSDRKTSSRYRKTGQSMRSSLTKKRDSTFLQLEKVQLDKYFMVPPNKHTSIVELKQKQQTPEQIEQQLQLRALQKRLYYSRELKKMEQLKQLQRIQELKRRKSPPLPKHDFTYAFDGQFMKRKVWKNNSLYADEMKVSQSFDQLPNQKKRNFNNEILDQQYTERGKSQLSMRYKKASIFNNSNKRQVSHLPFIQMTENSKIREENKTNQGGKTQRQTKRNFDQANEDRSFKHHSEIQKEEKQREVLLRMKQRGNDEQEEESVNEQPKDDLEGSSIKRRQSYMMNRYLKKLRQQNPEANRKSLNFNRTSFPKNTAIHNYYKHNFNEERKLYESEVISKVLDTSVQ